MLVGEVFARMGLDSKDYEKGLNKLEGYTQKRALTLGTIFKNAYMSEIEALVEAFIDVNFTGIKRLVKPLMNLIQAGIQPGLPQK